MKNRVFIFSMLLFQFAFLGNSNAQTKEWLVNGNVGITPANYLGTINAADLVLRTNTAANPAFEVARFTPTLSGWIGQGNFIDPANNAAFAAGFFNTIAKGAHKSIALGWENRITEANGYALGTKNIVSQPYSGCFGIELEASGNRSYVIGAGTSGGPLLTNGIDRSLMVGFSSNPTLFVNDGQVGIGTSTPTAGFVLDINGSGIATGGIWFPSDKDFKKDIRTLGGALDKIRRLRGTEYTYRTDEFKILKFPSGHQIGFIAQELKEVFPELVKPGLEGHLAVNYVGIIPVLVEALKEQQMQIEEKDAAIACLQNKTESLEARLAKIETALLNSPKDAPSFEQPKKEKRFGIVPNPSNGHFQLTLTDADQTESSTILIFDGNGREVLRRSLEAGSNVVDFSLDLPNGLYSISLLAKGKLGGTQTFVVTK